MAESHLSFKPCIIVHGGAGTIPLSRRNLALCAVKEAALAGYKVLQEKGCALDAVEAATRSMESSGVLNAGYGSYLTEDGTVELDAMIMDGQTLNTGAVACVQNIANPISLARKVMTDTPHCLLAGEGAEKFARKIGFPILEDPRALITDYNHQYYMKEKLKRQNCKEANPVTETTADEDVVHKSKDHANPEQHDTVGAVALDTNGHVAVSSSTGI